MFDHYLLGFNFFLPKCNLKVWANSYVKWGTTYPSRPTIRCSRVLIPTEDIICFFREDNRFI